MGWQRLGNPKRWWLDNDYHKYRGQDHRKHGADRNDATFDTNLRAHTPRQIFFDPFGQSTDTIVKVGIARQGVTITVYQWMDAFRQFVLGGHPRSLNEHRNQHHL